MGNAHANPAFHSPAAINLPDLEMAGVDKIKNASTFNQRAIVVSRPLSKFIFFLYSVLMVKS